ncbi:MBL fold metallo-hydrolase [uncultured Dokdonia sp.]|uniref:MBL fold metallo-hydrolase n=1 Tax=uncultured Dokdonia sp. TaxID=575653 RepID=UPI0026383094|nr:MBL fold metallo-hydrolase [uncultured Dokdonia sp.]
MHLNITAYSTALFSTWINIEELGLLFDAGDGVTSGLLQKSGKIKYVFITHPDRDHINGIFQLYQLNARKEYPKIYYPKDSGSFSAMKDFLYKFDTHIQGAEWHPIKHLDTIEIRNDLFVEAIRNEHVAVPQNVSKSLSFKLYQTKQKLKKEFSHLDGNSIKEMISLHGRDHLMETIHTNILSYAGDTPVDDYNKWDHSGILIHESTFLQDEGNTIVKSRKGRNKHSKLNEVLEMVSNITIDRLILQHFSSRYSKKEINENVIKLCKYYNIKVPVHVIYPGEIHRDILNSKPLYNY